MKTTYKLMIVALLFCFATSLKAQTAGNMIFTYTTINPGTGWYNNSNTNKYVLAVWIESCTTCGAGTTAGTSAFVRTKLRYCTMGSTEDHLPAYGVKAGATSANCITGGNVTNATTGATQTTFGSRTITWDGLNAAQTTLLADGNYRVCIQETWGHGASTVTRYFPFVKGANAYTNTTDVTADTRFSNISLTWSPTLASETFSNTPDAVVYPNPTSGIFNIEVNSEVKNIKVANILGEEIYNQNIDSSELKKQIDLSNFANGVYIISVTNGSISSSYKVVLNK